MTAGPTEKPGRYQRSANGMVGAMVVLVLLVGGFVAVQALGRDQDVDPVKTVDYQPVRSRRGRPRSCSCSRPNRCRTAGGRRA